MTPERLEHIRSIAHDLSGYESGDHLRELLAELDRLRAAADGLEASVRETYDENAKAAAQSAVATHQIVCALTCEEVLKKGRELGLFAR